MRPAKLLSSVAFALGLAVLSVEANAGVIETAEAALQAGKPRVAETLLQGFHPKSSAETNRANWVTALALLRQNRAQEAIPLLESLVIARPDETRLRLELARAYFVVGRDGASRREFSAARAGKLAMGEAEAIDSFMTRIEARKTTETYLRFAIVPESNAVRRTAAETINLGAATFVLNANARAQSGVGVQLGFGHTFLPRLSPTLRGRFGLHVNGKLYRQSDITEATLTAEAGLEKILTPRTALSFGALAQVRFLGGKPYTKGFGAYLGYVSAVGSQGRFSARAEVMNLTYPDYNGADGLRSTLSFGYRHAVSPSLMLTGSVVLSHMDAKLALETGTSGAISLGVEKAFDGGFVVAAEVTKGFLRRNGKSVWSGSARKDDISSISVRLYHSSFQIKGFAPTLELGYERQKSNVVLNDFSNAKVSMGFTKRF